MRVNLYVRPFGSYQPLKLAVIATLAVVLSACSSDARYHEIQSARLSECNHMADKEYHECVKRDIKLVEKVDVQAGDELTVLDISMEKNMVGLEQALYIRQRVLTI